ncbi:MAG: hypothetical protein H7Y17_00810 [Chlorobia bacterium]|nr:hypothetical protein [Fimbriimonadaceae bacterium]
MNGNAQKALLVEQSGSIQMGSLEAQFETPIGKIDHIRFENEDKLQANLDEKNPLIKAIYRVKVPRIMIDGTYGQLAWPPAEWALKQLLQIARTNPKAFQQGTADGRIVGNSKIEDLFARPVKMWIEGLRQQLGASWNPKLWSLWD